MELDLGSYAVSFLKKAKGRVLLLGQSSREIEKVARKRKIELKSIGRFFYKKKFDSSPFFELAKKESQSFDYVLDLGFSPFLYKSELSRFYTYLSRILKFKGILYSLVLSTDSGDCKKRCPVRQWSYFDRHYVRFVEEQELKEFVEGNFRIDKFEKKNFEENVYFEFWAVNDMRKF